MACGRPNGIHRPVLSSGQAHVLPRRLKIRSQSANGSAAKEESMSTTSSAPETEAPPAEPEPVADHEAADEFWGADTGATTAEYAITTLAACGFAALLVVILKSEPIKELVTGVIQTALGMGS
jgi:predicted cobalt transporter CbtA